MIVAPLVSRDGCCFDLMHIKTATYIVGAVELLYGILTIIVAIISLIGLEATPTMTSRVMFVIWIGLLLLFIVCTVILFYALYHNKPKLIKVHLVASLALVVFVVVYMIYVAVIGYWWNFILFVIFLLEMIFLMFVEYRCYRFMRKFP